MTRACVAALGLMLLVGCNGKISGSSAPESGSTAPRSVAAVATTMPSNLDTMARFDGFGDMRFGMDDKAFRQAWQGELRGTPRTDGGCYYVAPKWVKSAADFGFLFEHGRFVRYDVAQSKETAPGGGKVGMTVAEIRAIYGSRIEASPHKYEDGALYLRVVDNHQAVLLFEADVAGKITRWRVGLPPQVDYVEGCS